MGRDCGGSADHPINSGRDGSARKGESKVNNDYIQPEERTGRPGRRSTRSRIRDAWLRLHIRYRVARISSRLHAYGDRFVVAVSLLVLAILIWLALDDLGAWIFGLPPVTL